MFAEEFVKRDMVLWFDVKTLCESLDSLRCGRGKLSVLQAAATHVNKRALDLVS
jgi:hypothetical protein